MNKKRALLIAMIGALVGAFFVIAPASASTGVITFGDSAGDLGYSLYYNGDTTGQAVVSSGGNPGYYIQSNATTTGSACQGATNFSKAAIEIPWYSTYITSITVDGYGNHGYSLTLDTNLVTGTPVSKTAGWHTHTFTINASGITWIRIYSATCFNTGSYNGLDNVSIVYGATGATNTPSPTATLDPSTAGWNKPLRSIDQKVDDISFHPGHTALDQASAIPYSGSSNANIGFSVIAGQNVYAITSGTIDSVVSLTTCFEHGGRDVESWCEIYWDSQGASAFFIHWYDVYLITETFSGSRKIRYLVESPRVKTGDTVTGGCLIGVTMRLISYYDYDLPEGAIVIQGLESDGITSYDLSSKLVAEPSGIACQLLNTSSCALVANANFAGSQGWQDNISYPELPMSIAADGSGMTFPGAAQQIINLDSAKQYEITLHYTTTPLAFNQSISIQLGTTTVDQSLSAGANAQITIGAANYTPDRPDGLYTLGIYAWSGASDTTLNFICISESGTAPPAPVGNCLVVDPDFSIAGADSPWWDGTSSPDAVLGNGRADLPDGANILQSVTLYPADGGGNQDYTLTVSYRRKGITAGGESVSLIWTFGAQNGTLPSVSDQFWTDRTATISVITDPDSGPLTIEAAGSDSDQVAQIMKICIIPSEGGNPPGYQPPAPFVGGCRFCVFSPTGDVATDLAEYVQWLGCQFYQLWECQAKILLRYIWQALVNILTLFGFFRLWLSATLINLVQWGNGNLIVFANWLYGQINNAAQQIIYAILTLSGGGGSGTNLWDFLIALINGIFGLLQVFVQLVANIMQLIISGVIGFLVNGVGLLLGLLQSVINGLNTAPATINAAWLPNCNDASSGLFVVCSAIYGVESGLAIGPFQYLVPIGVGLGALNLLWWGIAKIKGVFTE